MHSFIRFVVAVAAGILVAFAGVAIVEMFSAVVHPAPPDFDDSSMKQMRAHVANYPAWVLAVIVPVWGLIAWFGTWVAASIGGKGPALTIGILLMAAVIFNISILPYPVWFKVTSVTAILAGIYLAYRRP